MTDGNLVSETSGGRLEVIQRLKLEKSISLSVGSSSTRIATVNVDISVLCGPDVVADALHLPFISGTFDEVVFTDVIEHIHPRLEQSAIKEIRRVLTNGGRLLISTPNDRSIFVVLDPSHWLAGHRHYSPSNIVSLLEKNDFRIESVFTSGGVFAMLGVIWYSLVTWPFKKIFENDLPYSPSILRSRENAEYQRSTPKEGYSIFAVAKRD
jgi:SAM-dependent methyltransferase